MNRLLGFAVGLAVATACGAKEDPTTGGASTASKGDSLALRSHHVSVLFPASAGGLWRADLPGHGGPLLPRAAFELNQRSLTKELADEVEYEALRVVSLRIDPCFQRAFGGDCEPQVRLVLQALDPASANGGAFLDGAVHALYALDAVGFREIVDGVSSLGAGDPTPTGAVLGVHPVLAAEGVDGPYGQGLRALVQRHLGPRTLTRVTFMTRTAAPAGQWQFSGFDILDRREDGALEGTRITIAGIGATMQNVTRDRHLAGSDEVFVYTVHPLFAEKDGRLGASGIYLAKAPPDERQRVHAWALRQESASSHLPDTTDCASCHAANHIGRRIESLEPTLRIEAGRPERVISPAERDPDNLRAFGYFGSHPQVAQRTANETAAVLERLRRAPTEWHRP